MEISSLDTTSHDTVLDCGRTVTVLGQDPRLQALRREPSWCFADPALINSIDRSSRSRSRSIFRASHTHFCYLSSLHDVICDRIPPVIPELRSTPNRMSSIEFLNVSFDLGPPAYGCLRRLVALQSVTVRLQDLDCVAFFRLRDGTHSLCAFHDIQIVL